jgi:putative spermidine/putrescine transport system substrate-binding protein
MSLPTVRRAWRRAAPVALAAGASLALAACGSSSSSSSASSSSASSGSGSGSGSGAHASSTDWSTATSAAAGGGLAALVKAAKAEGTLNVIALPPTWANYGELLSTFKKKYGIKIVSANPDGSSQDELNAVKQLGTQSRAPDVVDVGQAYALAGAQQGMFAPYKVASWNLIPAANKAANGDWFNDYGGYISIGCNTKLVKVCPTSFKQLLSPAYKGDVALDGNPTEANAAFSAVYAAALANGGSFSNINPGLAYFKKLIQAGNFNKTSATQSTISNGQTPIVIDWDYLNAAAAQAVKGKFTFSVAVPTDASYAAFYAQAVNKNAPHPAAARLWEEFLYSKQGQNLWLKGLSRPVELPALEKSGAANQTYVSELPKANPDVKYPTPAEATSADTTVAKEWGSLS